MPAFPHTSKHLCMHSHISYRHINNHGLTVTRVPCGRSFIFYSIMVPLLTFHGVHMRSVSFPDDICENFNGSITSGHDSILRRIQAVSCECDIDLSPTHIVLKPWYTRQDGYRLVTVHIHGDFVVLSHWETRPLTPRQNVRLSHIITTPC